MTPLTATDLDSLRQLLHDPTLDIFLSPQGGSQNPGYREFLRAELDKVPNALSASISHTEGLGGFVFTSLPGYQMGFDIEPAGRVSPAAIQRVTAKGLGPTAEGGSSPTHLWVAKEAAFKALRGPDQPATISKILTSGWTTVNSRFETFCLENRQNSLSSEVRGVVFARESFIFCVSIASFKKVP